MTGFGDDDKTPAKSFTAETLANTAVALSAASQRLHHLGNVLGHAAERCSRDSHLVDDLDRAARTKLLEDAEDELGIHAEALHNQRRQVRDLRRQAVKGKRT